MLYLYRYVLAFQFVISSSINTQQLEIHHINVGLGEATLIISPSGTKMLIDGGVTGDGKKIFCKYKIIIFRLWFYLF
jgi:hypothetical protein